MPEARLDIVIVNWNSGALLGDCLAALAASTIAAQLHVIVVDNASSDGSEAPARAPRPGLAVTLLANADNHGFGAACNQGAAAGRAPAVLFLNPDTRVEPETLELSLAFLDAQSSPGEAPIGVLGVRQVDEAGRTQRTCARLPTPALLLGRAVALDKFFPALVPPHFMLEWDHENTRPVAQVMGAFLMIRRALFSHLGGFDERFFVYYEDFDLCLRAGESGHAVVHFAGTRVWHQGQGTTAQVKDRRLFYILRSEALFAAKRYGPMTALPLLAAQLLVQVPMRCARAAISGAPGEWRQVLRGASMLLADLPRMRARLFKRG